MPFKPESPTLPIALAGFSVLAASGADAEAFLQAQTMNNVPALAPGRWQWNGWLTPRGRVIALFALARLAADRFVLVLPDHPAEELRSALQRFVFRSKVALSVDDSVRVAAGHAHPGAAGPVLGGDDSGWALDFGGDGGPRTLWLLPASRPPAPAVAATDAAWRAADLAHGLPRLGPAQRDAWTPQMLSLERLAAFSVRKGCYPGQEIVARTHFLGQAKRGLVRLRGDALAEGATVLAGDRAAGTVVSVDATGDEALAVLASDAQEPFTVDGRAVGRLPMNGGLERVT